MKILSVTKFLLYENTVGHATLDFEARQRQDSKASWLYNFIIYISHL